MSQSWKPRAKSFTQPVDDIWAGATEWNFMKPDMPSMPGEKPVPTLADVDVERQRELDRLRARKGRASTILTSVTGVGTVPTATKRLTGE